MVDHHVGQRPFYPSLTLLTILPHPTHLHYYPLLYPYIITLSVYGITGKGSALSTVGVFEANNQSFSPADLASFQANFGLPNQVTINFTISYKWAVLPPL